MFNTGSPYSLDAVKDQIAEASTRQKQDLLKEALATNVQQKTPLSNRELIEASGCAYKLRAFDALELVGLDGLVSLRCGKVGKPATEGVVEFILMQDCTTFRARFVGKPLDVLVCNKNKVNVSVQLAFFVANPQNNVEWKTSDLQYLVGDLEKLLNKPVTKETPFRPF
jgi:hypothetical protein